MLKPLVQTLFRPFLSSANTSNYAGNVLRRLCELGGEACAQTCALHQGIIERAPANTDKKCADDNLVEVVSKLGMKPGNILMVGVTADGIGFADEVDNNFDKYPYKMNENTNVKELPGFNAFFARQGDQIGGDEVVALGRRLADCGDVNLEFIDHEGKNVMGFMRMTKPNLQAKVPKNTIIKVKKSALLNTFYAPAWNITALILVM